MTSNKIPEASAIQQEMRRDLRWFETLLYRDVSWRYRDAGESWKYRSKACVQNTRSRDLKIEKPENGDGLLVRENLGVDWKGDSFPYWDLKCDSSVTEMWSLCIVWDRLWADNALLTGGSDKRNRATLKYSCQGKRDRTSCRGLA